jgi:hypothetical protein
MVIKMHLFSLRSSKKKKTSSIIERIGSSLVFSLFLLHSLHFSSANAIENNQFKSTCYDWRGNVIPCDFQRQYAELLFDKPIPDPRFSDNQDGTVTDNLTGLIWLKNTNCFGMMDWESANLAAKSLKDGDCGPDPALILSDGSSAGDWRLPTMNELCILIDYSRRNPALPNGHMFSDFPPGFYWSATTLDYHPAMAWIVYIESGTTCYDDIKSHAGHIWPVRKPKE